MIDLYFLRHALFTTLKAATIKLTGHQNVKPEIFMTAFLLNRIYVQRMNYLKQDIGVVIY